MRKLFLSFGSILAFASIAQAQADFRPGYIVQASGDTLHGQVDYRGAQRSARLARFRSAAESAVAEYTPAQLRGYGFADGKQYQTEPVALAGAASEPFFLEVIVLGPASLLSLRSKDDAEHLYLRKAGQPMQELIQRTEETFVNDIRYLHNTNEFQRTLAASMQDCSVVQPSLTKLRYSVGSLAAVVRQYNACVGGASSATSNPDEKNAFRFALIIGGQASRLDIRRLNAATGNSIRGKAQPTVGIAAHIALARLNPHLSVRLEALYSPLVVYKTEYDYKAATDVYTTHYQMEVEQSSIRIPLLLRYTFPSKRVQPFIQAGVSGNALLQLKNQERTRFADRPAFPEYTSWRPIVEKPRRFEQGVVGGFGLNFAQASGRNLSAEVRYERTNGFSDNVGTPTSRRFYSVLLSYSLTK
ncbi:porin family protein [Hymenobacter sp. GOD-10R]|uniref:porin family protein n=1 Tax=Hymenobacter sp. GOD-10R TaxID=3093922 RepID=UPI002D799CA5|nr:porin family protein [Hymenobacter sp. GOD-10R]WRQ29759.1 porin family protein [Hymenobacter sp. GOD-10R]